MSADLELAQLVDELLGVGSAGDSLTGPHLFGEDLLHRRALLVAGDLPLRGVSLGDREPLRGAELFGHRLHPLDELLEPGARGDRLAALEVDQLARQPQRIARQRFSSSRRCGHDGSGSPSSIARAMRAVSE